MASGLWGFMRVRITVFAAGGAAVAAAAVLVAADLLGTREADSAVERAARTVAVSVAERLERPLAAGDRDVLVKAARRVTEHGGAFLVVVFDHNRRVAAAEPAATPPGPVLGTWPTGDDDQAELTLGGVHVQASFQVIRNGGDDLGGLWLAIDRRSIDRTLERSRGTALAFAAGFVALWAFLAWLAAGRLMRPFDEFGETVAAIGRGELTARQAIRGPKEMRLLAERVNRMAEQLEGTRAEQTRLAGELDAQVRDRTRQLEQANRLLLNISHKDPLTNIENRLGFERELEKYLSLCRRSGQPLAVIMMDLDGFKAYNDTWGHPAGDQALIAVGAALKGRARASDTVGRLGGDEFCIVIPSTKPERAIAAAEGFVAAIVEATRDLPRPGANATLGASAGVACFPEDGEEAAELLARADAALYRAKAAGKGRVFRAAPPLPDQQA
ncbi:MAG: diguanylate cyclase [Thermoanaerobaculaceae bacterium]|nr:diguanylate cyclase [Thermoanaerobaculaceae bacterium]